jgi:hypothetical protein
MQGEKIGDESGRVTLRRTIANPGGAPKVETTFEASGSILGVNHMTIGTYVSMIRPDGTLFGEGQGVARSKDGAMASWVGQGVGTFRPDGGLSYRGALFYQSPSPQWARLNTVAAIFEYEVDSQGNTKAQIWEWK